MVLKLNNEQEMIVKFARDFAEKEIAPIAAEIDKTGVYPEELLNKLKKAGFFGMNFPREYGGAGIDYLTYIMVCEEIGKACASTAVILGGNNSLSAWPIYQYGTPEQKEKYLKPLCTGEKIGAFALTEPNAGSDAASQQTTAVLDGDEWVLNGTKIFITNGGLAETYIVIAMTDKNQGTKGISAFIVEYPTAGFTIGKKEEKMGLHGSSTTELIFENCRIPKENLLGKVGKGFNIAMATLDGGRIGVAIDAVAIAQRAIDESVKYVKQRVQFGKPIARNQAVQFMLADMETRTSAARLLTYDAAIKKMNNIPCTKESAMAKLYAAEVAMWVTTKAVQLFGGYGYTTDYPVERLMREAKIQEIFEGTSEVQRMVIAGQILR